MIVRACVCVYIYSPKLLTTEKTQKQSEGIYALSVDSFDGEANLGERNSKRTKGNYVISA